MTSTEPEPWQIDPSGDVRRTGTAALMMLAEHWEYEWASTDDADPRRSEIVAFVRSAYEEAERREERDAASAHLRFVRRVGAPVDARVEALVEREVVAGRPGVLMAYAGLFPAGSSEQQAAYRRAADLGVSEAPRALAMTNLDEGGELRDPARLDEVVDLMGRAIELETAVIDERWASGREDWACSDLVRLTGDLQVVARQALALGRPEDAEPLLRRAVDLVTAHPAARPIQIGQQQEGDRSRPIEAWIGAVFANHDDEVELREAFTLACRENPALDVALLGRAVRAGQVTGVDRVTVMEQFRAASDEGVPGACQEWLASISALIDANGTAGADAERSPDHVVLASFLEELAQRVPSTDPWIVRRATDLAETVSPELALRISTDAEERGVVGADETTESLVRRAYRAEFADLGPEEVRARCEDVAELEGAVNPARLAVRREVAADRLRALGDGDGAQGLARRSLAELLSAAGNGDVRTLAHIDRLVRYEGGETASWVDASAWRAAFDAVAERAVDDPDAVALLGTTLKDVCSMNGTVIGAPAIDPWFDQPGQPAIVAGSEEDATVLGPVVADALARVDDLHMSSAPDDPDAFDAAVDWLATRRDDARLGELGAQVASGAVHASHGAVHRLARQAELSGDRFRADRIFAAGGAASRRSWARSYGSRPGSRALPRTMDAPEPGRDPGSDGLELERLDEPAGRRRWLDGADDELEGGPEPHDLGEVDPGMPDGDGLEI